MTKTAKLSELAVACRDAATLYKRRVAGMFMLVSPDKLSSKLAGKDFCVTRKLDGMLAYASCDDGKVAIFGTGGRDLSSVPVAKTLLSDLKKAKIKQAEIVCELYAVPTTGNRSRVGDVVAGLADSKKAADLRLAPFDIVSLNGAPFHPAHYKETHAKLCDIFKSEAVHPVQAQAASSIGDVTEIYNQWVGEEGAEGLVVHSEMPMVWKIKPRHTIDAAVVGFTLDGDAVRDLLFAVRRQDGMFRIFAVGSGGLSDEQKTTLAEKLAPMAVESHFVRTDSRGIAYRMVRPEIGMELSTGELVAEDSSGKPKKNVIVSFDGNTWVPAGSATGVTAVSLSIVRERDDKDASPENVRESQLSDICPFAEGASPSKDLPKSEILKRRVFKKTSKDKVMLLKFLVWKTNKESDPRWPAYVFHFTDFSSGRKDPLKRDIRISDSEDQIMAIFDTFIADNVKKGWNEV